MLVHWIWLAHRPGLTDRMKLALLEHFQEPEELYFADSSAYDLVSGVTAEAKASLQDKDLAQAEHILEHCRRERIHLLTCRDAAYPARLKNIADPPVLLYYKGTLPDLDGNAVIGVVGTRKASAYGLTTAKRMGYQIGRCGGIVVSGMAYGIDGMAMAGCLTAGQPTVGVLGCGVDIVYPLSNRALFRDTESYGCILSEFAPGTQPAKWTFPKRNRIIAGLSCGVLVVEAPEKSGALITAHQALDQGRDVFVVPGNIDVPTFEGSNNLLREGAIPVRSGWDVLSEYAALYPDKIHREDDPARQTAYPEEVETCAQQEKISAKVAQKVKKPAKKAPKEEKSFQETIDKPENAPYSDVNTVLPKLSAEETAIVAALKDGQRLVDDVIAETAMSTGRVLALLTMLELKGIVQRHPGKRISLK
ncbi:MAG: DNA-processing protein DprA [Oscillospiraceae bacterium]|nr:DNA-processing protein DprA [Oscillospiraceae bacterium]